MPRALHSSANCDPRCVRRRFGEEMGRLLNLMAAAALAASGPGAWAHDFDLSIDLRVVDTTGQPSYLHGGMGKLRFDDAHEGLRLGSLRVGYRGALTDTLRFTAEAVAY